MYNNYPLHNYSLCIYYKFLDYLIVNDKNFIKFAWSNFSRSTYIVTSFLLYFMLYAKDLWSKHLYINFISLQIINFFRLVFRKT